MESAIIIQARINSQRLPKKILIKVGERPLIEHLLRNLSLIKLPIILAVPENTNDYVSYLKNKYNIEIFTGDEKNVLKRYYGAAVKYNIKNIIRVTGDNPFTSITCLKKILSDHINLDNDLSHYLDLPWGSGAEVISFNALEVSCKNVSDPFEKEHITQYIYRNRSNFKVYEPKAEGIYKNANIRLTVDNEEDLKRFQKIYNNVKPGERGIIETSDIISFLKSEND
jgi:spore coat polysaccharide biosynthesis protein SpsF